MTISSMYASITAFDNLWLAYRKAAKGKRGKATIAQFAFQVADRLLELQDELVTQTYRPGPYQHFTIHEPKRRKISAAPFRDRVVHHALCNLIEPCFEARFIADSYANCKEKVSMARTANEIIATLPKERQERIQQRSEELVQEYMALQELRKALALTQTEVAEKLHISQDGVSRLEQRSDLLLSTLRKYIQAMGGELSITARFPHRPPVEIIGLSESPERVL